MKTCQEIEVQLQVIAYLNGIANEAEVKKFRHDAYRIRFTLLAVANLRLENCNIRGGEFWDKLQEEMEELGNSLSSGFRGSLILPVDPGYYLKHKREEVQQTNLPAWVFLLLLPIEKWVFDWNREVPL